MGGVKLNRHHGLPRLPATTNGRRAPSAPAPLVFYRRCVLRIDYFVSHAPPHLWLALAFSRTISWRRITITRPLR